MTSCFARSTAWLFAACLAALFSVSVPAARADAQSANQGNGMDFALQNLSTGLDADGNCPQPGAGGAQEGRMRCMDINAWRALMGQAGFGMAPPLLAPASTTGYAGFYLGVESWITGIESNADYWQRGTAGDTASQRTERLNRQTSSPLAWVRANVRKGFPFGFELGTSIGMSTTQTSLWTLGLEIKWSIFEGFRTGIGYLPDLAVRGSVQTMVGTNQFNLTIPGVDVILSKPFSIAGMGLLTPFISGQVLWILADSELVDLTPEIDALAVANDTYNNVVFPSVRASRYRATAGLSAQYEIVVLTGSFTFDLLTPNEADAKMPVELPRQWTVNVGLGAQFE